MSSKAYHIVIDNIHRIINLRHVTHVVRKDNVIKIRIGPAEDYDIVGFLFGNSQHTITCRCANAEEAANEIEKIKKIMQ
jgi:hypothetical protein